MKKINLNNLLSQLVHNQNQFLMFLKTKFPLFHNSNIFLRDIQFGIKNYFANKRIILSYSDSEKLALLFAEKLTAEEIFKKVSDNCWKLNNLSYVTEEPGDPFSNIQIGVK